MTEDRSDHLARIVARQNAREPQRRLGAAQWAVVAFAVAVVVVLPVVMQVLAVSAWD